MTREQIKYLESVGITGEMTRKVNEIADFYKHYLACDIEDLFISEFLHKDGSRIYENLWFFNGKFCYEAKQFNTLEDYDSDVIKNSICWFTIKKSEFNIVANVTNDNSRMVLEFGLKQTLRGGELKATKENCKQLSMIFKKYILPNYEAGI